LKQDYGLLIPGDFNLKISMTYNVEDYTNKKKPVVFTLDTKGFAAFGTIPPRKNVKKLTFFCLSLCLASPAGMYL
jgi:hypothetical protein